MTRQMCKSSIILCSSGKINRNNEHECRLSYIYVLDEHTVGHVTFTVLENRKIQRKSNQPADKQFIPTIYRVQYCKGPICTTGPCLVAGYVQLECWNLSVHNQIVGDLQRLGGISASMMASQRTPPLKVPPENQGKRTLSSWTPPWNLGT